MSTLIILGIGFVAGAVIAAKFFGKKSGSKTINSLTDFYINKINQIILDEERRQNSNYVGGSFKIQLVGSDEYRCSYDLYFEVDGERDPNLTTAQSQNRKISELTSESQTELRRERTIEFEIDHPQKK